ncbi:S9 family peptidase [Qaidamihabitans albus]|uniref:S9 family peptidase n=1 Tax=Qaidamihabitans albus TaxID=2795733 RepID=UPI0018F18EB0|nr:prolyl oligopeptidase family serine peptidase [Qaidamihabitans albus]
MISDADQHERPDGPFTDLDAYADLPRLGGLWLSPDGGRLVVGVALPDREKNRFTTALWEVDPQAGRQARRLTRSAEGESAAAFTPSGDLLFVSARPEPGGTAERTSALWVQPAGGGDARVLAAPPGGVRGVAVSAAGTAVFGSAMMPSATGPASDGEIRAARKDAGVSAILHDDYPIRYWDRDLGPDRTRLLVTEVSGFAEDARPEPRDITGHVGGALDEECTWDITPDGRTVVAAWTVPEPAGSRRYTVVAIDVATGERRTLADDPDHEYDSPRVSPDGTHVALAVREKSTPERPGDRWLGFVPVTGGELRPLATAWDRWPRSAEWTPDGTALVVVADDHGRAPLWRVDITTGQPTRLTRDDGAYTDIRISPDGRWVYALRSAVDSPPAPVRVALDGTAGAEPLPGPAEALGAEARLPGRLTEVSATAEDGTPLRAWLALPHGAGADAPAPLLLWIHGGPVMSANVWSWRWNPWLLVSQGYAVLQPDPALSTGYGIDFVRRGWNAWGGAPYTDLMSVTEAARERTDIDGDRIAAMGGSFGGYMANWIAGQTDRFAAIVTHASIWALDQMTPTTDLAYDLRRELSPEAADAHSPHGFAGAITTPMLVIHGDKDYRVPIGEALRLWWDLRSRSKAAEGSSPHKFLYFPDENHWILTPNHARVWYSTVRAFLAQHVRGEDWRRPALLG